MFPAPKAWASSRLSARVGDEALVCTDSVRKMLLSASAATRPTTRFDESILKSLPTASGFVCASPMLPPFASRSMLFARRFGRNVELSPVPLLRASRIEPAVVAREASPWV